MAPRFQVGTKVMVSSPDSYLMETMGKYGIVHHVRKPNPQSDYLYELISAVKRSSYLDVNEKDIKSADENYPANVGGSRKKARKNRRVTKKARKNRRH